MTSWIAALADPAERTAAEAARHQRLKDSAARMAKAKTGCALTLVGTTVVCGDPAVGLCDPCRRAFCEPHGSSDIGSVFLRVPDLCCDCQKLLIETSLAEHLHVAATLKARIAQRRTADKKKLARKRRTARVAGWDHWARRSGSALVGLVLVAAGAAAGLRADHVLTSYSTPMQFRGHTLAVTPFAVLGGIAVVLGLLALLYATRLGGAAARSALAVAAVGVGYLTVTLGVLLWRSRGGEFDWVTSGSALGGACLWLVGGHLTHRPAREARAQKAGTPQPRHLDLHVAVAVAVLVATAVGAAAYLLTAGRS